MTTATQPTSPPSQGSETAGKEQPLSRPAARQPRAWSVTKSNVRWLAVIPVIAVLGILTLVIASSLFSDQRSQEATVTATVRRATVPIVINAGGELESSRGDDVVCEVEGSQLKIVEMLPEGMEVNTGQVVLRLDPSEINDRLAAQRITVTQQEAAAKAAVEELKIQQNLAASQTAQAELALQLAELDKKKYLEGEYQVEQDDLQGLIALAEADLQDAKDTHTYFRMLVKKGFRTPEQLRAKAQAVERAEYALKRDQRKLTVLEQFMLERQKAELTANAAEAKRELERVISSGRATVVKAETDLEVAEATADLERQQLAKIQKLLEYCDVRANADGTLVYAKDKNKRIELGETVHFKQRLFSVPDMSQMQVQTFVHEAEVKKVRTGMEAEVRVDAFPDLVLHGSVQQVSNFYDSTRHWLSGGVKEYATIVKVTNLPEGESLKPGMTAEVKILAGELSDGLIVPLAAVTEADREHWCYVAGENGIERRSVEIGAHTNDFVEIISGLSEGEKVALDARHRAVDELNQGQRHSTTPAASNGTPSLAATN